MAWRVDVERTAALHSLNNDVTVLVDTATEERFVARRPRPRTADRLGVLRREETIVLAAAAAAELTPAPIASTEEGVLLTPFITTPSPWTGAGWTGVGASRGHDLIRRLLACPPPAGVPSTTERVDRMLDGVEDPTRFGFDVGRLRVTLAAVHAERSADRRYEPCLTHHDLWANNVIDDGDRLWLVDYEFAGAGDGWFDLATVVSDAGLDRQQTIRFLQAVGRAGDRADLRALAQGTWLFHVFEMLWGAIMAEQGEQRNLAGDRFDYAGHARRIAGGLSAMGPPVR